MTKFFSKSGMLLLFTCLLVMASIKPLSAQEAAAVSEKTVEFRIENLGGNSTADLTAFLEPGNVLFTVDRKGFFVQPLENYKVPITLNYGTYTLKVINKNNTLLEQQIEINATTPSLINLSLQLAKASTITSQKDISKLKELTIKAKRKIQKDSKQLLIADEIRFLPGAQGDALKALSSLPGVMINDRSELFIRGGNQEDIIYTYDGLRIGNPYHQFGQKSIFPISAVRTVDFYPGAYFSEYGEGQGANININSKFPQSIFKAEFDVNLQDTTYFFSVPLVKDKLFLTSSGRRSYFELYFYLLGFVIPEASNLPPPNFFDNTYKFDWNIGKGQSLALVTISKHDYKRIATDVEVTPETGGSRGGEDEGGEKMVFPTVEIIDYWNTTGLSHVWQSSIISNRLSASVLFSKRAHSIYGTQIGDRKTYRYALEDKLTVKLHEAFRIKTGVDYVYDTIQEANLKHTKEQFQQFGAPENDDNNNNIGSLQIISLSDVTRLSNFTKSGKLTKTPLIPQYSINGFFSFEWDIYNLSIIPGVRGNYQIGRQSTQPYYIDPRLAVSYQIIRDSSSINYWSIFTRLGQYSQVPQLFRLTQKTNVRSQAAFTPFIENPLAYHYVGGTEIDVSIFNLKVEGYYQDGRKQLLANPNYDRFKKDSKENAANLNTGQSRAYGIEALLKRKFTQNQYGWLSYTYSDARRYIYYVDSATKQKWILNNNDNTHTVNLLYSYNFNKAFKLGAKISYLSGTPRTPQFIEFYDRNHDGKLESSELFYYKNPAYINVLRNPAIISCDVRFDWIFNIFDGKEASLYLDIQGLQSLFYNPPTGYRTDSSYLGKAIEDLGLNIDTFKNSTTILVPVSKLKPRSGSFIRPSIGFQMYL